MKFADVVAPRDPDTFVDRYVEREWVVLPGPPSRYGSLVPWPQLNAVLNGLRLSSGSTRLRVVKDGTEIAADEYLESQSMWGSSIRTGAFERLLSDGATLVLNGVHELFEEIRQLTEDMERTLQVGVWANLYAGWRTQRGFDLHWDDHDTFILQVHGRKAWKVYSPTCEYPVKAFAGSHTKPTAPPVWDGILESGSMLYMPRGWWHVAAPLDEPTLHVTFGLKTLKGADVLGWLTEKLAKHQVFRRDAPIRGSLAHQQSYVSELREAIGSVLSDDCFDDFRRHVEAHTCHSTRIDLPASIVPRPSIKKDSILLLAGTRALETHSLPTGALSVATRFARWTCSPGLKNALSQLSGIEGRRVDEVRASVEPTLMPEFNCLLTAMSLQGELLIRTPSEMSMGA